MLQLELRKSSSLSRSGKLLSIKDSCPIIAEDSPLEPSTLSASEYSTCHLCSKRFSRSQNLERHLLGHSNRDNFECGGRGVSDPGLRWGCKQSFKSAFDLYDHLQSDRGRWCIAHLLAEEGLQISREAGELEPSFSFLTAGSDAAPMVRALPLPMSLLRQVPELRHFEQLASLDHESYQSLRVFKSRFNSTSSRSSKKSGVSDEGYYTADGDIDTSPEMALAPVRRHSSRLVPNDDHHPPKTAAIPSREEARPQVISYGTGEPPISPSSDLADESDVQPSSSVILGDQEATAAIDSSQTPEVHDHTNPPFQAFRDDSSHTRLEDIKVSHDEWMGQGPYQCTRCGQRYIYSSTLQLHRGTSPLCSQRLARSHLQDSECELAERVATEGQICRNRTFSPHTDPPTDLEWESVQKDVHHCYVEREFNVGEVQRWLNVMRDFRVTEQMVETQLRKWGYDNLGGTSEHHVVQSRVDASPRSLLTSSETNWESRVAPVRVTTPEQMLVRGTSVGKSDAKDFVNAKSPETASGKRLNLAFRPSALSKRLRLRKDKRSVSGAHKNATSDLSSMGAAPHSTTKQRQPDSETFHPSTDRREFIEYGESIKKRVSRPSKGNKGPDQHQLEFMLSKTKSDSADPGAGQTRELPSPTLSKSTNKPNNNSESELSFIDVSMSSNTDRQPLDQPDEETQHFVTQLAIRIVFRCVDTAGQKGIRCHAASNSSSQPSSSNSKETPTTTSSIPSKRPRPGDSKENDSQEDDEGSEPPDSKKKRGNGDISTKLFACPYAKHDPERYSERNHSEKRYRKCNSKYLNSITRVKQHLYRTHARPSWYCGNCYESFESRECLNEHIRRRPPCESAPVMYEEMMTDDQFQAVKRRSVANDPFESWFKIFDILFPDATRPLSPYVSTCDPTTVAHFVSFFRRCGPEELLNLMRDRREQNGEQSIQLTASTQAIVDEAFEIALPDYLERLEDSAEVQNETAALQATTTTSATFTRPQQLQRTRSTRQSSSASMSSSSRQSEHRHIISSAQSHHSGATSIFCGAHVPAPPNVYAHDWTTQNGPYIQHALHAIGEQVNFRSSLGTEMEAEDISFLDPSQVDRAFDAYDVSVMADVSDAAPGPGSYEWIDPPVDAETHPVDLSMDMQWQYLPKS